MLCLLRYYPPVNEFELFDRIRPYVVLHHIHLTRTYLTFPETNPLLLLLQSTIPELEDPLPRNILYYADVLFFEEDKGGLTLFLKTGSVCILSRDKPIKQILSVYPSDDRYFLSEAIAGRNLSAIFGALPGKTDKLE